MKRTMVKRMAPKRIQNPVMKRGASLSRKRFTETISHALTEIMYMAKAIERFPTGAVLPAIQAAYKGKEGGGGKHEVSK